MTSLDDAATSWLRVEIAKHYARSKYRVHIESLGLSKMHRALTIEADIMQRDMSHWYVRFKARVTGPGSWTLRQQRGMATELIAPFLEYVGVLMGGLVDWEAQERAQRREALRRVLFT